MSFLEDFRHRLSGYEVPDKFLDWSALTLLSAVAGRKIWTMHGDILIDPRLMTCMVGTPGSGKSTAMGQAEALFLRCFPNHFVSESVQSREDLLNKMSKEDCIQTCDLVDESRGWPVPIEEPINRIFAWRPFFCLVDEMENFVSVDAKNMVATLVGLYGRDSFGTGFKNDPNKNQRISFPYLTLLGCTIPEWMMSSLRESLFIGGLGRRLNIVHDRKTKEIENPMLPPDHKECWERMCAHLQILEKHYGCLRRTPEAEEYWSHWFRDPKRKNKTDPILMQFHETSHIQCLKIAIGCALSESPITLTLEARHIEKAAVYLRGLDEDVIRLTSGIGRNELAGVGARVLEFIDEQGGSVPRQIIVKTFTRYFQLREFNEQMDMFMQAGELFSVIGPRSGKQMMMRPAFYHAYMKALTTGGTPDEVLSAVALNGQSSQPPH
jgi:hypothetical protein